MSSLALRPRVIQLYKNLLYLGRDYPQGYDYFRTRCHNAFMKNKDIKGEKEVRMKCDMLENYDDFVRLRNGLQKVTTSSRSLRLCTC